LITCGAAAAVAFCKLALRGREKHENMSGLIFFC